MSTILRDLRSWQCTYISSYKKSFRFDQNAYNKWFQPQQRSKFDKMNPIYIVGICINLTAIMHSSIITSFGREKENLSIVSFGVDCALWFKIQLLKYIKISMAGGIKQATAPTNVINISI